MFPGSWRRLAATGNHTLQLMQIIVKSPCWSVSFSFTTFCRFKFSKTSANMLCSSTVTMHFWILMDFCSSVCLTKCLGDAGDKKLAYSSADNLEFQISRCCLFCHRCLLSRPSWHFRPCGWFLELWHVVCQRKGGSRAPPTCVWARWGVGTLIPQKTGRRGRLILNVLLIETLNNNYFKNRDLTFVKTMITRIWLQKLHSWRCF